MKRLLFGLTLFFATASVAQKYTIDNGHTAITTKVMRFGVVKVVGRFNTVSGLVTYNPASPGTTSAEIILKADSYTANNLEGEMAVKSLAFLDVATYPEIKFVVKSLKQVDKSFIATGELTLHGVTKEISFPVYIIGPSGDLPTGKQSIGISAELKITRQDYGISMARRMPNGQDVIGNDVEIEINALALAQ